MIGTCCKLKEQGFLGHSLDCGTLKKSPESVPKSDFDELLAMADELACVAKESLWIDECRCDAGWTIRDMHEPNTYCGELDDLRAKLKKYKNYRDKIKE